MIFYEFSLAWISLVKLLVLSPKFRTDNLQGFLSGSPQNLLYKKSESIL